MPHADQLVGEARARRARKLDSRERTVYGASALAYLAAALALALLVPDVRDADPLLAVALLIAYALVLQVRFEFGGYYAAPEQLAFVPLLLIGPLPYVALIVAAAGLVASIPQTPTGTHRHRWLGTVADSWANIGGILVLALLAPGPVDGKHLPVYLLAFGAHLASGLVWSMVRDHFDGNTPVRDIWRSFVGTARVDLLLAPAAFVLTLAAVQQPLYLLAAAPLIWLFHFFSLDRRERYSKTLELQRAYRGTVMLLSDVVESDDAYTAEHSRSVVELVNAVADELSLAEDSRQEVEFAAMLHDVGKISIPKDILHKPAALTANEYEIMKTHTIEGQFMLDRVGGLLGRVGEIVRSCHERWDGTGYPDGLRSHEIPFAARLVFCCDAYNAMTTDRVYRKAMSREMALAELRANSGTQFDPVVVAALTTVVMTHHPEPSPADEVRAVLASAAGLSPQLRAGELSAGAAG